MQTIGYILIAITVILGIGLAVLIDDNFPTNGDNLEDY